MEFKEFVKLYEKIQTHANPRSDMGASWAPIGPRIPTGAFGALPSQVTGSQWGDMPLYSGGYAGSNWLNGGFDLRLPGVTKTSQIKYISEKKNPMLIFLADGTRIYIPYDAYKKINVPPEVGRTLMVTFQRRTDDTSPVPSKIDTIHCY